MSIDSASLHSNITIRRADNGIMPESPDAELTQSQRIRLADVTARLRGELHRVVVAVPLAQRTVQGLSALWEIDRNLSQRVLAALSPAQDDLEAFCVLPGTRGLAKVVEGAERVGGSRRKASSTPLRSALESFDHAVRELGGSQAAIVRQLRGPATHNAQERRSDAAASADHADSPSKWIPDARAACWVDLYYGVSGVAPSRKYPGLWQNLTVTALVGTHCGAPGASLPIQRTMTGRNAGEMLVDVVHESLAEIMQGSPGVLKKYSTGPVPRLSTRYAGGEEMTCVDLEACELPVDVVTGVLRDRIDTTPTPTGMCWAQGVRVRFPARLLTFDHYVHRSLDERWIATGNCFWWSPTLTAHPMADWPDRIAVPVRVERDESERPAPPLPEWARAEELNRDALAAIGWRPSDFVRYRVWVDQPVWGSMVYLTFLSAGPSHDPSPMST